MGGSLPTEALKSTKTQDFQASFLVRRGTTRKNCTKDVLVGHGGWEETWETRGFLPAQEGNAAVSLRLLDLFILFILYWIYFNSNFNFYLN